MLMGLTGSIATGKSTVLGFFSGFGAATIDSDAIVAQLYKKPVVKKFLKKNFGTAQKKALAKKAFSDKALRLKLEAFLHPLVFAEIKKQSKKLRKRKIIIVDVPLLFEKRLQKKFSKIIVVKSTRKQQLVRLRKKGFSKKEALARINSQLPISRKLKKADFIIDNRGSVFQTRAQVKKILEELK